MSFDENSLASIELAKEAALQILLHNAQGPFEGLPRTAGWGYPEPYTRDLMISALGFLATGNELLADALERTLVALANNQTLHGHIPSLAHDPANRGSSDSTPLFLFALALYRISRNQPEFLLEAAEKARKWMQYQSPDDRVMVAQLPTSDWRDEQYVMGYGLYVNMIVYAYLRLFGEHESAEQLRGLMSRLEVSGELKNSYEQEALVEPTAPYYALYSYKVMSSDRFDLLGNSLAILTGIASSQWATNMLTWIEAECEAMRGRGELTTTGECGRSSVASTSPRASQLGRWIWQSENSWRLQNSSSRGTKTQRSGASTNGFMPKPENQAAGIGRLGRPLCTYTPLSVCCSGAHGSSTTYAVAISAQQCSAGKHQTQRLRSGLRFQHLRALIALKAQSRPIHSPFHPSRP
jgi:hypothetical protein